MADKEKEQQAEQQPEQKDGYTVEGAQKLFILKVFKGGGAPVVTEYSDLKIGLRALAKDLDDQDFHGYIYAFLGEQVHFTTPVRSYRVNVGEEEFHISNAGDYTYAGPEIDG